MIGNHIYQAWAQAGDDERMAFLESITLNYNKKLCFYLQRQDRCPKSKESGEQDK